jgi:hypothetical protein
VGQREARLEREISAGRSGWIAARVAGKTTTYAGRPVFAHTNPVYIKMSDPPAGRKQAARELVGQIESFIRFIRKNYRFASEADKALALGRFEEGRNFYAKLMGLS